MRLGVEGYFRLSPDDRTAINEWLSDHGVDWTPCFAVRLEGEGPVVAECHDRNEDGKYYVVGGERAVVEVPFFASWLPDRRIMADWMRFGRELVAS